MTQDQKISLRAFKECWNYIHYSAYKNISGAFWDIQVIYEPYNEPETVILLTKAGKDSTGEDDDDVWISVNVFWLDITGEITNRKGEVQNKKIWKIMRFKKS